MEALSQRFSEEEIADYTPAEFLDELLNRSFDFGDGSL